MKNSQDVATILAQAGHYIDAATGAIVPPFQPSTTYARDAAYGLMGEFSYARSNNPGLANAERLLAGLDGGADAMLFASGMAGIATAMEGLRSGDHVVAPSVMYHGTRDWLKRLSARRGVRLTSFDASDEEALARAIEPGRTQLVWIESAVNPTWDVIDIAAAARHAHAAGARLAVDSTVSPPVTTQPLALGADLVFHSCTKYMNGHSDVTCGLLVTREDDAHWRELREVRTLMGGIAGSFEAWLLIRGLRTLAIRYERASANALEIAEALEAHPALEAVLYPGLEAHPGHAIAARQMHGGYGGMLSLLVKGDAERAKAVANRLQVFVRATSLGGVESLIEHRATVESPGSLVPANLLRLSIGIEAAGDLIADLNQALDD